jgi:hypothetical protein
MTPGLRLSIRSSCGFEEAGTVNGNSWRELSPPARSRGSDGGKSYQGVSDGSNGEAAPDKIPLLAGRTVRPESIRGDDGSRSPAAFRR